MRFALALYSCVGLPCAGCGADVSGPETGAPTSSSSTTSSNEPTASGGCDGPFGDGGPGFCDSIADVVLSDPVVKPLAGDGTWSPNESATIMVTLTNTGATKEFAWYPGVMMESNNPDVTSTMPRNTTLSGLTPCESAQTGVTFFAGANVPSGTTVHFTATVTTSHITCRTSHSLGFDVAIQ